MKTRTSMASILFVISLVIFVFCPPANAGYWESNASSELTGSRTSPEACGIDATDGWDRGGFKINWDISQDSGIWTYRYTINVTRKDPSHFILEVTEDGNPFNILTGTDAIIEGPQIWNLSPSNPLMPNDIYGIKFDFGGDPVTYTIVTDRAPVYGVFYAKDGKDSCGPVVAWSNALNFGDYKSNETLTPTDFIVRPDGTEVPIPGALWFLGSGLMGLLGFRMRFTRD